MKSLRGGAFDTYFDSQATCQFQSGDSPLARKRNIGFRLAVGLCDLSLALAVGVAPKRIRAGGAGRARRPIVQRTEVAEAEEVGA